MSNERTKTGLSFVVCCHNSKALIKETIIALNNQANRDIPYEVILVDNNCTDSTVRIAKTAWTRTDADLVVMCEKKPGLSFARKRGVKKARYEVISFIDDDNIVEENWISKVCSLFKAMPNVGAVGSRNEPIIEGETPFWFDKYQLNYACGSQLPESGIVMGERKHLWGAGLSIRTEIVRTILFSGLPFYLTDRVGNVISSGGDSEICMRCTLLGWDLWYESDLTLKHKIPSPRLHWKYLCKLHEGFGSCSVILKIYKSLIDNAPPDTYSSIAYVTSRRLLYMILRHSFRLFSTQEGEDFQRQFYFLWGFLKCLIKLRTSYDQIVYRICSTFPQRQH